MEMYIDTKMVKPSGKEEEEEDVANPGPTKLDVLGIGNKLFEQIFIHERFGDVSDEVCDRMSVFH